MYLRNYIEKLQTEGNLFFTKEEALKDLDTNAATFHSAANYLVRKHILAKIKPNFFVIVPAEERKFGVIPAREFIDPLMEHLAIPYYVGLLSAAEIYGASHHRPQELQVVIDRFKKDIRVRDARVAFFRNNDRPALPTRRIAVRTGYVTVSSPEVTALDLVRYYKGVGFLDNVGTVLSDLVEQLSIRALGALVKQGLYPMAIVQRLGFILADKEVGGERIAKALERMVHAQQPRPAYTVLNPSTNMAVTARDERFRILVNDQLDID